MFELNAIITVFVEVIPCIQYGLWTKFVMRKESFSIHFISNILTWAIKANIRQSNHDNILSRSNFMRLEIKCWSIWCTIVAHNNSKIRWRQNISSEFNWIQISHQQLSYCINWYRLVSVMFLLITLSWFFPKQSRDFWLVGSESILTFQASPSKQRANSWPARFCRATAAAAAARWGRAENVSSYGGEHGWFGWAYGDGDRWGRRDGRCARQFLTFWLGLASATFSFCTKELVQLKNNPCLRRLI